MNQSKQASSLKDVKGATLIADSGATTTDWALTHNGQIIHRFSSKGLSPIYQTREEISKEIKQHVLPELNEADIKAISFYGSGCIPEKISVVENAIRDVLPIDFIEVHSDLIAVAHSLCGNEPGIACILGTGSNSCEWDGEKVVKQISPLGFILGDEGSGAVMGKLLVSDALKNQLTAGMKEKLLDEYKLTPADIIDKVYRQPFPSRFLASLSPFLLRNIDDESIRRIPIKNFSDFFERNVMQLNYQDLKVNSIGSIGWYFADILREVAADKGITIGKIEQSPMSGLVSYHSK